MVRQIRDLTSNIRIFDLEQIKMPFTEAMDESEERDWWDSNGANYGD